MRLSHLGLVLLLATASAPAADPFHLFQPVWSHGELIAAAAIATDAPYHADKTGRTDCSKAIQQALQDVWSHGGGTVYLPAGRYRLDQHLEIPHTVSLCGDWQRPEPGQPLSGTILLAYADRGNADGPPLLNSPKLSHANVFHLTIYYPDQNPTEPVPYPFSVDGKVAYLRGITLVNSYQGIRLSTCSGSSVADIYGTCLKRGLLLQSSSELCSCYRVRLSSDYWTRLPEAKLTPAQAASVRDYVAKELVGIQIGKVDGLSFYDADLSEAHTPVLVKLEEADNAAMIAPRSQYGFGGGLGQVKGARTDVEDHAWYFGTHYFDLDNYPELADRRYTFAPLRLPDRTGPEAVYQASEFGVAGDGVTDDADAMQRALDAAAEAGGGTVLVPHGITLLKHRLTVPSGVELRGGYLGVPVRNWYIKLSTLILDCDADTPDPDRAPAGISLQPAAGLVGLNVCHAKNLWELDAEGKLVVHPYPFAIRGLGDRVYIREVSLPNAYHGIDLGQQRCDGAQVIGLWGTSYQMGIRVGAGSDRVRLENINLDVGPLSSDYRLVTGFKDVPGAEKRKVLQQYVSEHAVSFVLGDCTRLTTWDLAGFNPYRFMEFIDQGAGGCRDASFWSSIFDVPTVEMARFRGGGRVAFYGLFTTGGRDDHSLWAEFDPTFGGSIDVYGLCQQRRFNNRPFEVGSETLRIHLEHSLTTGRPATADSGDARLALDADPRTRWQSSDTPGPHTLTVELAQPTVITRWRVHNAGNYLPHSLNTLAAELSGSVDGERWVKLAEFRSNNQDWVDLPLESDVAAKFVRLTVTQAQKAGTGSNQANIAAFDAWGHPAESPDG